MLIPNPYFRDESGKSKTRAVLIRLFASCGGPVDLPDGSAIPASAVLEPSVPSPTSLYDNQSKDIKLTYIGRASKCFASDNPSEELWCVMADISQACKLLTPTQREVIAYKHVYDYTDQSISDITKLTIAEIADAERTGLDKLVAVLDNEEYE